MTKVVWQLTHYPGLSGGGWGSGTVIIGYEDIQLNLSTGSSKDRFNFKIDIDNTYSITTNDKIKFSRRFDDSTHTDDDVLMFGVVRTVDPSKSGSSKKLTVSGYNYSESVATGLIFVDATNLTIPEMFQEAISNLQLYDDNYTVTWAGNNTKSDGSNFSVVGEKIFYKSFSDILDKYSESEYTEDGLYYWYVNNSNEVIWRPIMDSTSGIFNEESSNYTSLKVSKNVDEVKNFVVVKGGYGPNNKVLDVRVADYSSISRHGFKFYILADEAKTVDNIYQQDLANAGLSSTESMEDASYPFTPYWSGGSSFGSFSSYASAFNVYARNVLKQKGKEYINANKYGKLKVSLSLKPFDHTYRLGFLVTTTITTDNFGTERVRVVDINYTSSNDAITLEEDEGSI